MLFELTIALVAVIATHFITAHFIEKRAKTESRAFLKQATSEYKVRLAGAADQIGRLQSQLAETRRALSAYQLGVTPPSSVPTARTNVIDFKPAPEPHGFEDTVPNVSVIEPIELTFPDTEIIHMDTVLDQRLLRHA